jgi:replicative DNA helicase
MTIHARTFIDVPTALEAEQALLGAILHNAEALDRVRSFVEPEDFGEELHAVIFRMMTERRDAGGLIDSALVRLALGDKDLGGVTLGEYVARLFAEATTIVNAPDYAKAIRHAAMMRKVLSTAQDAVAAMSSGAVNDPTLYASGMIEALDAVATSGTIESVRRTSMGHAARDALQEAGERLKGTVARGAPYGIPTLDRMTLGMRPGQFIVVAGRPGMGKTALSVTTALACSMAGYGTYFASHEMMAIELAERALSAIAYDRRDPIPYFSIADGKNLTDHQFERLYDAQRRLDELPFVIEQQSGLTVSQILARARQAKAQMARKGETLAVLIVDHLGLVRPSTRYAGNRVQEMTEITGALKVGAKELEVAVVALCQLSRRVEERNDKRPMLADLRDSGSIEQDADVVIGLYRHEYYLSRIQERTAEQEAELLASENTIELELLKQRKGPTGRIQAFCDIGNNVIAERAS